MNLYANVESISSCCSFKRCCCRCCAAEAPRVNRAPCSPPPPRPCASAAHRVHHRRALRVSRAPCPPPPGPARQPRPVSTTARPCASDVHRVHPRRGTARQPCTVLPTAGPARQPRHRVHPCSGQIIQNTTKVTLRARSERWGGHEMTLAPLKGENLAISPYKRSKIGRGATEDDPAAARRMSFGQIIQNTTKFTLRARSERWGGHEMTPVPLMGENMAISPLAPNRRPPRRYRGCPGGRTPNVVWSHHPKHHAVHPPSSIGAVGRP